MLVGTKDLTAPVRDIDAKVEVLVTSTDARIGKGAVRFDNCTVGMDMDIQLSSDTVEDFTNIGTRPSRNLFDDKGAVSAQRFTMPSGEVRTRYGFRIDVEPGTYAAHAETLNAISANVYLFVLNADGSVAEQESLIVSGVPFQSTNATVAEGQYLSISIASSAYTQEQAEEFFYNGYNIQVESGNLNTPYEPFGDIQVGAEVYQYGKNLFDYTKHAFSNHYWRNSDGKFTTSTGYSANYVLIPVEHLQGKTITLNKSLSNAGVNAASGGTVFFEDNDLSTFISSAGIVSTFTVPLNAKYMGITIPRAEASGEAVQIEIGDTETAFEPYKEPIVAKATVSGAVDGLKTYSTNTLILGDTNGHDITLEASYSIEAAGDTFRCIDRLKSITLDRIGESKFFGFGIGQKANIKIIDRYSDNSFSTNDKFKIFFDNIQVSPQMRVHEVHRDENTGELSITTYDVLSDASVYTLDDVILTAPYTVADVTRAVAAKLKVDVVIPTLAEFDLSYAEGANFEGGETLREILNAIAEVTQTVYFMNSNNQLVFKRLATDGAHLIDKDDYFTLDSSSNRRLTSIASVTELGDNYEATTGLVGTTQYVRDNPLWELREDLPQLVNNAIAVVGNMTIAQFDCSWRGNYLVEPSDMISFTTKDGDEIYSYLINDTISYDGAYSQKTVWQYIDEETESTNPTNLGEALKQTYAKVDKANKQISIVASELTTTNEDVSQLQIDTGSIVASVSSLQDSTTEAFDGINEELAKLTQKASLAISKDEVEILVQSELANGVNKVETTTGFTFNEQGLTVSKNESDISTTITEDGMQIQKGSKEVLVANNEGVRAIDLHATTYLAIGKYSRFEDYGSQKRTACFWIGG